MNNPQDKIRIKNRLDVLDKQETLFKNYITDLNNEINKINSEVRVANYAESFEKINYLEESIKDYNEKIKEINSEKELFETIQKEHENSNKPKTFVYSILIILFLLSFAPFLSNINFTGYTTLEPETINQMEFNATLGNFAYINLTELNITGNVLNFSLNDSSYKIENNNLIIINTSEMGTKYLRVSAEIINLETNETIINAYDFTINILEENLEYLKNELQSRFTQDISIKSLRKENNLYDLYLEFATESGKKGYISIYGVPDLMNITDFQYTDSIQYIIKNEK